MSNTDNKSIKNSQNKRYEKEAAALRENLKKRKAQQRAQKECKDEGRNELS